MAFFLGAAIDPLSQQIQEITPDNGKQDYDLHSHCQSLLRMGRTCSQQSKQVGRLPQCESMGVTTRQQARELYVERSQQHCRHFPQRLLPHTHA